MAVAVAGIYFYMQKINSDNQINSLQEEVKNSQATIDELQSKIDSISTATNTTTNIAKTDAEAKEYSDTEIKKAIQGYLDLKGLFYGEPDSMLFDGGLGLKKNYADLNETKAKKEGYTKTDIKYGDFKQKILQYMTERCYKDNYSEYYIEEDGMLCYKRMGASGASYTLTSYNKKDGKYIAKVDFLVALDDHSDLEFEFELKENNGNLVVDYCEQIYE